jgi:peroxiredoxin Q/BCP
MIDLAKATKGRRMSKKTRKKSPKSSAAKAIRAGTTASAKTPAAKTRPATASKAAKKPDKKPSKQAGSVAPKAKASRKAPAKALKSPRPTVARRTAMKSNAIAAKREAANSPARKPKQGKIEAPLSGTSALAEGARAPAFRLPRDGGETVSLSDFSGKRLVLFFYPRADTPGCTREAIDFTRLASAFAESQTAVLGISADAPKAQEAFRDKHELSVPLVSDEQHRVLEAYGVWGEKSMYGRTFQGISRTTVLVGGDGRILRIWRNVKVDGHADAVLATVRAL